jgi:hypothetical protein
MPWNIILKFADPFLCQAALQCTTEAEILPTERGSFCVENTQIGMDALWLQRFNVALSQIGTFTLPSNRKAIGFLSGDHSPNMQHCGLEVTAGDILIYGRDEVHQRSERDFRYATMSLPLENFPTLCEAVIGREFMIAERTSVIRPRADLMARLKELHRAIDLLAHDTPEILEQPEVRRALEQQIIHVMLRCLAEGIGAEPARCWKPLSRKRSGWRRGSRPTSRRLRCSTSTSRVVRRPEP